MWMGPKAFGFYVTAAINYLRGVRISDGDSDAASSFCGLIEFRLDWEAAEDRGRPCEASAGGHPRYPRQLRPLRMRRKSTATSAGAIPRPVIEAGSLSDPPRNRVFADGGIRHHGIRGP